MISYGFALFLKSNLIRTINLCSYFTLLYDESMNYVTQNEQFIIDARFWNIGKEIAGTRYFVSRFLNRPNADNY